jgi:hypothetical protein
MKFEQLYYEDENMITDEMKQHFEERTNNHIDRVKKYCKKIDELNIDNLNNMQELGEEHDKSKWEEPEKTPYVYLSWRYKCKQDGEDYKVPEDMDEQIIKATEHHVKNSQHHPEYYDEDLQDGFINNKNRDKPSGVLVDGTKMPQERVAEMCADWCSMSEELGTDPIEWADKNINVRWKFNDEQTKFIYDILDKIFDN